MEVRFEGRGDRWSGSAEKAERSETDKHQPYALQVTNDSGESVDGTMLVTALAEEKCAELEDGATRLGEAFSKAMTAELGLRPLKSGFRFVVDHSWIIGY